MSPTAVPSRITIDFHDALLPSRSWILGIGDTGAPARVELLAFEAPIDRPSAAPTPILRTSPAPAPMLVTSRPSASGSAWLLEADCTCPEYCERDHANE